jgi:hypothetical protein
MSLKEQNERLERDITRNSLTIAAVCLVAGVVIGHYLTLMIQAL